MNQNKIVIKADKNFIIKWNKAFTSTFSWKSKNSILISRDYWLGKIDFIAPWHPVLFFPKKDNLFNHTYKIINDFKRGFSLFFIPENSFSNHEKKYLLKNNQLIHFIRLEEKTISEFFKSLKSRTRTYIKSGLKQFNFIRINNHDDFIKYKSSLRKILIQQHLKFNSACPPIELLENLLINQVIDIYLAIQETEVVGFATLSNDKFMPHVFWIFKSDICKSNSLSLSLYFVCIEESIKRKAKLLSLGTSISASVSRFKEKLSAERGILFKYKINNIKFKKKTFLINTGRKTINLTLMKLVLRIILLIFGVRGFEVISKQIWKRFD